MSTITATFTAPPKASTTGKACALHVWLDGLPDDERNAVRATLDDARYEHEDLKQRFNAVGLDVTAQTVSRFRRGVCKCEARGA